MGTKGKQMISEREKLMQEWRQRNKVTRLPSDYVTLNGVTYHKAMCEDNKIDIDFPGKEVYCAAIDKFLSGQISEDRARSLKSLKNWKQAQLRGFSREFILNFIQQ